MRYNNNLTLLRPLLDTADIIVEAVFGTGKLLNQAATFPALIIFGAVAGGGVLHYFFCWRNFKSEWVRMPFLCGENVSSEEVASDSEVRSYDFHSVGGKIEHSHVTNYYFLGVINEKLVTGCLNWSAWLIILVLIGNTLTYISHKPECPFGAKVKKECIAVKAKAVEAKADCAKKQCPKAADLKKEAK